MTEEEKYNGWTNYATWGVALILSNDEYIYDHFNEHFATIADEVRYPGEPYEYTRERRFIIRDYIVEYVGEMVHPEDDMPGANPNLMQQQLLMAALGLVDWQQIADHYADDVPYVSDSEDDGEEEDE